MKKLVINGGKPLKGEVTISGAKNSTVAVLAFVKKMPNVNKQMMRPIMYGFFNFLMKAYHKNGNAKVA